MIQLNVCIGSACHVKGTYNMIAMFQQLIEEHNLHEAVELKAVFCMGHCGEEGVSVRIGENPPVKVTGPEARKYFLDNVLKVVGK